MNPSSPTQPKKSSRKEVGPTKASGSGLAASQEEISQRKAEMEELKKSLLADMRKMLKETQTETQKEVKKDYKEIKDEMKALKTDIRKIKEELAKEVKEMVKSMLNEWKTDVEEEIHTQLIEVTDKIAGMERMMEDMMDEKMEARLSPMSTVLDQQNDAIKELTDVALKTARENDRINEENKRLSELLRKINEKCIDLEGRQRRKNLRIVGLPEGREGNHDPRKFFAKLLKDILDLDQEPLLGRAHRALRPVSRSGAPPRQVIVKVVYDGVFEDMMKIIIRKRNLKYEGDNISIFRDYPAEVAKRRALFTETRRILRDIKGIKEIRYGLVYPAILRVTYEKKDYRFIKHTAALEFARKIQKKAEEGEEGEAEEEGADPTEVIDG